MTPELPRIDRKIFDLLKRPEHLSFTVGGIRDNYAREHGVESRHTSELRRFIYERIIKLIKAGLVKKDQNKAKRKQLFHVLPELEETVLDLEGETFEEWQKRIAAQRVKANDEAPVHPKREEDVSNRSNETEEMPTQKLETQLKQAKAALLESIGEAEQFQNLISEHPILEKTLSMQQGDAHDRSCRLLGRVTAIEKTLAKITGGA